MATRIETWLIDDVDGTPAVETVRFGLDGTDYEIDLSEGNAEAMRGPLTEFVDKARRTSRRQTVATTRRGYADTKQIRAWAVENGITVNSRGRLHASVVEAYERAHSN